MMHPRFAGLVFLTFGVASPTQAQEFEGEVLLDASGEAYVDGDLVDLDGDGDLDALVVRGDGANLYWVENGGEGVFTGLQKLQAFPEAEQVNSVLGVDLDGDGDTDVLATRVSSANGEQVGWFENLGAGRLDSFVGLGGVFGAASFGRAGDLDGDGAMDLVFCQQGTQVLWKRGLVGGSFGPPVVLATLPSVCSGLEIADLDGDRDLDVVWTTRLSDDSGWLRNQGAGSFSAPNLLDLGGSRPNILKVADLDRDGDLDLLHGDPVGERIRWTENMGTDFGVTEEINNQAAVATHLAVGDVDGDGLPDVVATLEEQNSFAWYRKLPGMNWGASFLVDTSQSPSYGLFVEDLEGDGDVDAILLSRGLYWSENPGSIFLVPRERLGISMLFKQFVDFEGDGDLDVLGTDRAQNQIVWAENLGDGVMAGARGLLAFAQSTEFLGIDLDLDGDMDLVNTDNSFFEVELRWFRNDGGVLAPAGTLISSGITFTTLTPIIQRVDMDADGQSDLFYVLKAGASTVVGWLKVSGQGLPTNRVGPGIGGIQHAQAADLNGDSLRDYVLTTGAAALNISWYPSLAMGGHGPGSSIANYPATALQAQTTMDLDGDGDVDLLVANRSTGVLEAYANDGLGGFASPRTIGGVASEVYDLVPADLDEDGDLDLILVGSTGAVWRENMGAGMLGSDRAISMAEPNQLLNKLVAADWNGDGDLDLGKDTPLGAVLQRNLAKFGDPYCLPTHANSSGEFARIFAGGSPVAQANELTLRVDRLPTHQAGFFLVSGAQGLTAMPGGSQGNLCLGGGIGRLNRGPGEVFSSGSAGSATVSIDLTDLPMPMGSGPIQAGQTRYFQAWYRDVNPGATSNFTAGVRVRFE